jgi:hypothetical protein
MPHFKSLPFRRIPRGQGVFFALVLAIGLGASGWAAAAAPFNVYLTYSGDTSRSIVVNYHIDQRLRDAPDPVVYIDSQPRKGDKGAYAKRVVGTKTEMDEFPIYRTLNAVEVTGLEPNTVYYFIAGDDTNGYTEERSFRTIPAGDEPIRFVTGGDMNVTPRTERLLAQAGKQDPLFCAIGGDIAYVNGRLWEYGKWDRWFQNYDTLLRTPEGHMVPMFMAIGNHETNDLQSPDAVVKAPFYTAYFARTQSEGKTYFARQFGKNIFFLALDTGHIAPHGGEQAAWLARTLAANETMLYKFAIYHVPLYPSHRPFEGGGSVEGRIQWGPYFDAYGLTTAFENHDHTLKRSKVIRDGQPDEDGVLYIGDGSFGVDPREVDAELRPYLEFQASAGHVWMVDVSPQGVHYRAIGEQGEVLDEYRQEARPAFVPALAAAE